MTNLNTEEVASLASALEAWAGLVSSGYEVPAAGQVMFSAARTLETLTTERATLLAGQERAIAEAVERERERCANECAERVRVLATLMQQEVQGVVKGTVQWGLLAASYGAYQAAINVIEGSHTQTESRAHG